MEINHAIILFLLLIHEGLSSITGVKYEVYAYVSRLINVNFHVLLVYSNLTNQSVNQSVARTTLPTTLLVVSVTMLTKGYSVEESTLLLRKILPFQVSTARVNNGHYVSDIFR